MHRLKVVFVYVGRLPSSCFCVYLLKKTRVTPNIKALSQRGGHNR